MSLVNYVSDTYRDSKEWLVWHIKYSNPISILTSAYSFLQNLERGTDYPMYTPYFNRIIKGKIREVVAAAANFTRLHESELNLHGKNPISHYRRLEYILTKFHIYSNETMRNCLYYKQLLRSEYYRINTSYNYIAAAWLSYNVVSGVSIIAIVNYLFRKQGKSTPTAALIASVPAFAAIWLNYHASDAVKCYFVNNLVRRLGHADMVCGKFERYPKNVEFRRY